MVSPSASQRRVEVASDQAEHHLHRPLPATRLAMIFSFLRSSGMSTVSPIFGLELRAESELRRSLLSKLAELYSPIKF